MLPSEAAKRWVDDVVTVDDEEIAEARWFAADALPKLPPSVSIARRLIEATAARLRDRTLDGREETR